MLVEQAMTKTTVCCGLNDSLEHIIYHMWNGDFGAVPIVNEHGMLVGIITDRDIAMALGLRHASPSQLYAGDLVSGQRLVSCSASWELKQALKLMVKEEIRRLPVVDDSHQVVGMLSLSDIASFAGNGRKKADVSLTEYVEAMKVIARSHHHLTRLTMDSAN